MLPPDNPIGHDCILLSLKFASGALGKTLVTIGCERPYSLGLSLHGSEGTLTDEKPSLSRYSELPDFMPVPLAPHGHEESRVFDDQAAHLVECLEAGRQPMADVVEGAKTVATCLAGIDWLRNGTARRGPQRPLRDGHSATVWPVQRRAPARRSPDLSRRAQTAGPFTGAVRCHVCRQRFWADTAWATETYS